MNIARVSLVLFASVGTLVAGEVSAAFRTLVSKSRSVEVFAVPKSKEAEPWTRVYSATSDIRQIANSLDFIDPKPRRLADGSLAYAGPCKCLPTHFITFGLKDGSALPLFLVLNGDEPVIVDVQKEDSPRLNMPWHTSLKLTPESEEAVRDLLKVPRRAANHSAQPTPPKGG